MEVEVGLVRRPGRVGGLLNKLKGDGVVEGCTTGVVNRRC